MNMMVNPARFGGSPYDAATVSLLAAFSVDPTSGRKSAINQLITSLKSAGIWAKLDALYLLAAHDAQAARVNWKNPGTFNLSVGGGSPTFTTDSNYSFDGVDDFLDTNFNPATAGGAYAQNSASFGVWSGTSGQAFGSCAGWFDGTDGTTILTRSGSDTVGVRVNQASTAGSSGATDGRGLFVANRSGSTSMQVYRNGSSLTLDQGLPTQASSALNSASFRLGSISASSFTAISLRAAVIGGSLNSTEQANLYSAMLAYLQHTGAV